MCYCILENLHVFATAYTGLSNQSLTKLFFLHHSLGLHVLLKLMVAPRVYILVRKRYSPPPSENDIFSPSRDMLFFDSHRDLFALIFPYFAFILPFYFPFFIFSPLFFHIYPYFSSPPHIFSPKCHRLILFPHARGKGIFQYIDPWVALKRIGWCVLGSWLPIYSI